jgi:ABC-2 type transport system permease protein
MARRKAQADPTAGTGRGASPATGGETGGGSAMRAVTLIARREIDARMQQKGFRWGTAVFLLVIAVAALVPKWIGGGDDRTSYDVGIVSTADGNGAAAGPPEDAVRESLQAVGGDEVEFHISTVASADAGREAVSGSDLDAVIDGNRILARSDTDQVVTYVQAALTSAALQDALLAAGLDAAQVQEILSRPPATVEGVESSDDDARSAIATVAIVVLFAQLIGYCSWVGLGVVEEKSSRVVELLLAAVRPWQLLLGKLIGIGALAIGQLLAMAAVGLGVIEVSGSIDLPDGAYGAVAVAFAFFVLGFAFFAAMSAALASLVSRQEEVSGVMLPVTALLMVSYFIGFVVAGQSDGTLSRVVAIVPPLSALTMPARVVAGDVPAWELALSLGLLVAASALVLLVAGRIYRAAVLHSGSRVSLREAWKGEAVASLR